MRKELDEALCKKYPKIFRDCHGDMRSTAMFWEEVEVLELV